jgi:hypothetical protein
MMELYAHDCSYLTTPYAQTKMIEEYNNPKGRAARAVGNELNEKSQPNPDERPQIFPVVGPGHQRPVEEVV